MFGYILPLKQDLKIKEYELFMAYYCGMCKSMSKRLGQMPRLFLNYDSTFFAILLSSISDEMPEIKGERCIAHQIKKRLVVRKSEIVDYAADINVILTYFSLKDKWNDDKSLVARAGMLSLEHQMTKLKKKYPKKCGIIIGRLGKLSELESIRCDILDKVADCFSELIGEILCYEPLCADKDTEKILRWIGYNIGKWVYIIDAFDDIKQDIKNESYNPILLQYSYDGGDIDEFKKSIKDKIEFNLTYTLSEISKAYELLKTNSNSGIVENIIFMGMLKKTEQILGTGSCIAFE
ncbi:MAG: DUF5685 family protein [Clostridia bacterium]|jgi:hypothetical protein